MGPFSAFMSGKKINYIPKHKAVEPHRLLGESVFFPSVIPISNKYNTVFLTIEREVIYLSVLVLYCRTIFRTYKSYFPLALKRSKQIVFKMFNE